MRFSFKIDVFICTKQKKSIWENPKQIIVEMEYKYVSQYKGKLQKSQLNWSWWDRLGKKSRDSRNWTPKPRSGTNPQETLRQVTSVSEPQSPGV